MPSPPRTTNFSLSRRRYANPTRGAKSLLSMGTSVLLAPHCRKFGLPPAARMGLVKLQLAHWN
jgi:hypothetical protein